MKEYLIDSIDQLDELKKMYDKDKYIYRGQTNHYTDDQNNISISSSSVRSKCNPQEMIKWTHYASDVLRVLSGEDHRESQHQIEALLQHYGWRSFYVDFTHSFDVATWFACNKYSAQDHINVTEDCHEIGILVLQQIANYEFAGGMGNIYIINLDSLEEQNIEVNDFEDIQFEDMSTRIQRQKSILIGPIEALPSNCITAHITCSTELLKNYLSGKNDLTMEFLFPARENDILLDMFLSVPFTKESMDSAKPVYQRYLKLPEYDYKPSKIQNAKIAFYSLDWLFESRDDLPPDSNGGVLVRAPDDIFYIDFFQKDMKLTNIALLMANNNSIYIEFPYLIRHPEMSLQLLYSKGVIISKSNNNTNVIEISSITVSYSGTIQKGYRKDMGYHYLFNENSILTRNANENDCTCNNEFKHNFNLNVICGIESFLSKTLIEDIDKKPYIDLLDAFSEG